MDNKKYVSLNNLQIFLDNLKIIFSELNHTHTKYEIVDLDMSEIVDEVLNKLPRAEEGSF